MVKSIKFWMSALLLAMVASTSFMSCGEDEEAPALTLVSLTASGIDLNGASSATGVTTSATITAEFNVEVDETTKNAITLTRQYDNASFGASVTVDGKMVTITPTEKFSTGSLFVLSFGAGLASTEGKALTAAVSRTFSTEGTFAVPGAIAQWTFEDNANDIIGSYDPTASQIIDITYATGRKADAGKAASFNGTSSLIEISNGDNLMNNGDWSMSIWVKPNSSLEKGQFVLGLGAFYGFQFEISGNYNNFKLAAAYNHTNGAGGGFSTDLWADGEGNLGWQGWTFSKDFRPTGGMNVVIKDLWAHYVFVYNATQKTGTVYLNGEKIKEQDFDNWPNDSNEFFATGLKYRGATPDVVNELALGFIQSRAGTLWDAEPWGGYDLPGANHFHGLMDDLLIYHKPLTQAEITEMYNSGKP